MYLTMNISHYIRIFSKSEGGTFFFLDILMRGLSNGYHHIIFTRKTDGLTGRHSMSIYSGFKYCFTSDILHPKILHLHGMWDLMGNFLLLKYKCSKRIVIVSPHGMLDPYSLSISRVKKQVALFLYQKRNLNNCDVIHSTSEMESENIRKLGIVRPIALIPIGINTKEYPLKKFRNKEQKKVLFLSRIHPIKGLDILIDLWASLDANTLSNWCLEIAGSGEQSYLAALTAKVKEYNLQASITFIGEVSGPKKVETFHSSDIYSSVSRGKFWNCRSRSIELWIAGNYY